MKKGIVSLMAVIFALVPILASAQEPTDPGNTTPLDGISDYAMAAALAGFVGAWIVALINRNAWPSYVKYGIFFVWCVIAAAVDAYYKRELDWHNWSHALLVVFFVGQATYLTGKGAINQLAVKTG